MAALIILKALQDPRGTNVILVLFQKEVHLDDWIANLDGKLRLFPVIGKRLEYGLHESILQGNKLPLRKLRNGVIYNKLRHNPRANLDLGNWEGTTVIVDEFDAVAFNELNKFTYGNRLKKAHIIGFSATIPSPQVYRNLLSEIGIEVLECKRLYSECTLSLAIDPLLSLLTKTRS